MSMPSAVVGFALVAAVITVTPGLDTALVLRSALREGRRHAFATAFGVCTGVLFWALTAAAGISALLTTSEAAYTTLRYAGALYLVLLGVRFLLVAARGQPAESVHAVRPSAAPRTLWASYRSGLLSNLLNPKVGAFYVAILPQFIPDDAPSAAFGTLLGVVHHVEGMLWFTLIILTAEAARRWLSTPRTQRVVDALTGTVLVAFALQLARATKPAT